ncbi:MAG TPA: glycine cleavage system aminomethyltransferase GcvT [Gemmatimonadota bacterium]|nr:glycine cleavage system aminomethyltransferase GcvT [Gemmatimonadota bacterium]
MAKIRMPDDLKRTGFTEIHERLRAKLSPFAGFLMPIQYSSITNEHHAVRRAAGVFDISHMGEFVFEGRRACEALQRLTVNDVAALAVDQAQYSAMVGETGGILDDCVLYRLETDRYMLVVNAANIARDWAHILAHLPHEGVDLRDESDTTSLLAVQGPRAAEVVGKVASVPLEGVSFYWKTDGEIAGVKAIISRTGYTGEDGFELYFAREHSRAVWHALTAAGAAFGLQPCGLGARDTLRLEMKYALYGNDIDETTNPYEAGLGWIVKLDKGDFIGRKALRAVAEEGPVRRLVGFRMSGRAIPRPRYPVVVGGRAVTEVRSGVMSPTLGYGIGTCYMPKGHTKSGNSLAVMIRDAEQAAEIVKTPFYTGGSLRVGS